MSKFKVGDKVCIAPPDDCDTGPAVLEEMHRWCGGPVVIERIVGVDEHDGDGGWNTLVGCELYYFAGDWMKKAVQFKGNK